MHSAHAPIMLISLTNCTNIGAVREIVGIAYDSGFEAVGETMGSEEQNIWAIPLPGSSVHSRKYRRMAHKVGLYDKANLGPIIIESDGCCYMTTSKEASPITSICGYIGMGPGLFTLTVETDDGERVYHIDTNVEGSDAARCWIDC